MSYNGKGRRIPIYRQIPMDAGGFLHGMPEIAKYMRVSPNTIRTWTRKYGLPIVQSPNGRWMSSKSLLDTWLLNMSIIQREEREEEGKNHGKKKG